MPAAFAGLSRSLPALAYAEEMQERAASLGYDWPDLEGVIDKVAEEAARAAARPTDEAPRREEFGDLLFVIVNLGRKLGVDAGGRAARRRAPSSPARFARVERLADERAADCAHWPSTRSTSCGRKPSARKPSEREASA